MLTEEILKRAMQDAPECELCHSQDRVTRLRNGACLCIDCRDTFADIGRELELPLIGKDGIPQ